MKRSTLRGTSLITADTGTRSKEIRVGTLVPTNANAQRFALPTLLIELAAEQQLERKFV